MSVNVPIGKGIGKTSNELKFPNLKLSQPENIQKMPPTPNAQAFLKQLDDEGRFVIQQGSRSSDGEVLSITPVSGQTFYLLGASCAGDDTGVQTKVFTLSINGIDVETIKLGDGTGGGNNKFAKFAIPTASIVGNGVNNIAIDVDVSSGGDAFATIYGYNETTPSSRGGG